MKISLLILTHAVLFDKRFICSLNGHWTSITSCHNFSQRKLGFLYTIRSVDMGNDYKLSFILKKYEFFLHCLLFKADFGKYTIQ